MSPEVLNAGAGVALSLLLSYVPRLSDWYAKQDSGRKALLMLGLNVAVAGAMAIRPCLGAAAGFGACFSGIDFTAYGETLFAVAVANQVAHRMTPDTPAQKRADKPRRARKTAKKAAA